jgi:hypothetical protein
MTLENRTRLYFQTGSVLAIPFKQEERHGNNDYYKLHIKHNHNHRHRPHPPSSQVSDNGGGTESAGKPAGHGTGRGGGSPRPARTAIVTCRATAVNPETYFVT